MKNILLWLIEKIDFVTEYLEAFLNIYIIIFLYAILYFSILSIVMNFISKEIQKRKDILQDVHLYKVTHPNPKKEEEERENEDMQENALMKTILHSKSAFFPENYYVQLHKIVDSYKPRLLSALFLGFLQYGLAIVVMFHLASLDKIGNTTLIYWLSLFFFTLNFLDKKLLVLRILFIVLISFLYTRLSSEVLFFLMITTILSLLKKAYVTFHTQKKKVNLAKKE